MQVKHKMIKTLSKLTVLTLVAVATCGVTPTHALTYQSETDLTFTFNPTLTLTVSGDNNGDLIIPNLAPGSALDSNIIDVTAGSNSSAGYTLSATVGSSANATTDLTSSSNGTFTSTTSNVPTLTSFTDDTWGYSYCFTTNDCSTSSSTDWISGATGATVAGYNALPLYTATGVKLVDTTVAGNTSLKFKIGAKASATKATGTYTNKINFTTIAKVITTNYTINYNANVGNTGDTVTGMPSPQAGTSTNGIVTFPTNKPVRENYIFKGWCDSATSDDTCPGIVTQPGGAYALNTTETSTLVINMYAMWKSAIPEVTIADATYMQDVTSCPDTLVTGQTYIIKDSRDNQSYTVAKLADGKCWMTSNLKLGKGGGEIITLTDADSGLPTGTTFDLKASGMGSTQPDATNGDCNVGDWYPSSTKQYLDVSHLCINTTTPSYGTYYNWYTAVAGTAGYDNTSGEAPGSICPKGWKLPPNSGEGSYYNLLFTKMGLSSNATSSTTMQSAPTSFLLSGSTYGSGLIAQGAYGRYWSSTAGSTTSAYRLDFNSSDVVPQLNNDKGNGYSVRCLYGL